jgi:hypothetical protein
VLDLLDATLAALMKRELGIPDVTISFAAPDKDFEEQPPALSFFLYDVRHNVALRGEPWQTDPPPDLDRAAVATADSRYPTMRHRAPARMECSYLITAWPGKVDRPALEEHRLLGAVLAVLLRHRYVPVDCLAEDLPDQQVPMPITVLPGGQLNSIGEFWQAMGGRPKATLHCSVTVALDVADPVEVAAHVVTKPRVDVVERTPGLDPESTDDHPALR